MECEILLTGIGGQGIQLAAEVLASAALHEGREVMHFGSYGGSMRGGHSDATVVLGDGPIRTPPTVTAASYAMGMHHAYWPGVVRRLVPGAVAVVNVSVFRDVEDAPGCRLLSIEASTLATDMGMPRAATMIALGALAAATRLVGIDSLVAGATNALPSYRKQHAADNAAALRAGMGLISEPLTDAWAVRADRVTA